MPQPVLGRSRIAVVNDDPEFLALLDEILEEHEGYEVSCFVDDETPIDMLRQFRPDLIIIDVLKHRLPSGWELALVAGADTTLGPVPIIVCSPDVSSLAQRVEELREVANVRVLPKPFTVEALRGIVHEVLSAQPVHRA